MTALPAMELAFGAAPVLPGGYEGLLLHEERQLLPLRASPKRRAEFAAGRMAARKALSGLLPPSTVQGLPILAAPGSGRPRVKCPAQMGEPIHVSITHVDGLALAAAARVPVGIDLVTVRPEDASFSSDSFAPGELATWEVWLGVPAGDPFASAAAFAAKEAATKLLGVGLTVPLLSFRVVPSGQVTRQRLPEFGVPVERFAASLERAEEIRPLSALMVRLNQHLMMAFT